MAVHVICCYFLPFLFFFLAQIAFPKSLAAFALGISALSISCIILYFKALDQKRPVLQIQPKPTHVDKQEPKVDSPKVIQETKISHKPDAPILNFAKKAIRSAPMAHLPNTKALIKEQQQAIESQKNLFTEELEKRTYALRELQEALDRTQQALEAKESALAKQTKEIEDLKFELYTLLRIESYAGPQKEQDASSLAAASF